MEKTVRKQVLEVAQLHQIITRMARVLEAHMACEEIEWHGKSEWLEDRERRWDDVHRDEELLGEGSADMTMKVLAKARGGETAPDQEVREKE